MEPTLHIIISSALLSTRLADCHRGCNKHGNHVLGQRGFSRKHRSVPDDRIGILSRAFIQGIPTFPFLGSDPHLKKALTAVYKLLSRSVAQRRIELAPRVAAARSRVVGPR